MEPVVLDRVCKSYGNHTVLRNFSLVLPPDTTTAVIGPSGSGKSTLLQLLNGLIRPDSGEVFVLGQKIDYNNLPKLRKQIGYAVQGTGLFPHLTIRRNISLLAEIEAWPPERTWGRVAELMQLVGLPLAFGDKYPHQLSGGEQQRVGLCRAMMLNPKLFLLDEPFGALDPITRSEIHGEFSKLQRLEARTIVLVTHDLREAIKLADEMIIINEGRIEQKGTPADILKNPASAFIERFVHLQLQDEIAG